VEIRATGVCHPGLHIVIRGWQVDKPLVHGHEAAEVITESGPDVGSVSVGDQVGLPWFAPCGRRFNCAPSRNVMSLDMVHASRDIGYTPVFGPGCFFLPW
jgi:D-arabinose 1-dehydrogenase-like Zn-dependent alcohol dehydrogenase